MNKDAAVITLSNLQLMCTKAAARMLGVSHRTLEDWRLKGLGPKFRKLGRIVRYHPDDIQEFLNASVFSNTGEAALAA